jgi:micrococcal nuclease
MQKFLTVALLLVAVFAIALQLITLERNGVEFLYAKEFLALVPAASETATVARCVDGDTLIAVLQESKETIRLVGVDTPESVHPRKPVEYFGRAASAFTKKLLQPGDAIKLSYDENERGKYGRLLAYVWFEAESGGQRFWVLHNLVLILNGYGKAYTIFPFRRDYMDVFVEAEQYAKEHKLGMWSSIEEEKALDAIKVN